MAVAACKPGSIEWLTTWERPTSYAGGVRRPGWLDLDALEAEPGFVDGEARANQQLVISRLFDRIYRLEPLDRQVILLYLEGEPAASIGEVTGLSAANVATKVHRIKKLLNQQSGKGGIDVGE
jgi:DNA-directed RNA polymerase specialized sigma24 family protein